MLVRMRAAVRLLPAFLIALGGIALSAAVTTIVATQQLTYAVALAAVAAAALFVLGLVMRFTRLRRRLGWLASPHMRLLELHGSYKVLLADLKAVEPEALDRPAFHARVTTLDGKFRRVMVEDWEYDWAGTKRGEQHRIENFNELWSHGKWISKAREHVNERLATLQRLMQGPPG